MAAPNPKNLGLSPAATDLGLGAQLMMQVDELDAERKKKIAQAKPQQSMLGGAAQALFGGSLNVG